MRHYASSKFWQRFHALPNNVQQLAKENYKLLKNHPNHPSLHYKLVYGGKFRSVRIGMHYRALGVPIASGIQWFWIGSHAEYDNLLR